MNSRLRRRNFCVLLSLTDRIKFAFKPRDFILYIANFPNANPCNKLVPPVNWTPLIRSPLIRFLAIRNLVIRIASWFRQFYTKYSPVTFISAHNYHYSYYLFTPWSRVLLDKLTGFAANQEIPRIL